MNATKDGVMMKKTKGGLLLVKAKAVYSTDKQDYEGNGVLIREGRILETGDWLHLQETYPQAEMLDYGECYLLPGLINTHVHLEFEPMENTRERYLSESPQISFLRAAKNAETLLYSGVTTARDAGGSCRTLELYQERARQLADLPRLQLAGPPITITGGHLHFIPGSEADSIDDTIVAVRSRKKAGCTAIKIIVSGGQMTPGSTPEQTSYTAEQIRAMTDEAHHWSLPTFAHCLTTEGFVNAMRGGVQCIEHCACFVRNHGNGLLERVYEPAVMEQFQNDSRYFMIGISNNYHVFDHCRENGAERSEREAFLLEQEERECRIFERLIQLGMLPVIGTDAGCGLTYFDETWLELEILYHRCRITIPELIGAATVNGAAALGLSEETGSIRPGLSADLIAMESDPLTDITVFRNIRHVMCRGKIIR